MALTGGLTRLTLIRHADTDDSSLRRTDPGLSELGIWQAEQLRDRLERTQELDDAGWLVSSDLARCQETASLIGSGVGSGHLQPQVEAMLREMSWGEAEGLQWEELTARYGEPRGKDDAFAPGGESWREFEERSRLALRRCAEEFSGSSVVIVCHTGIIEASFLEFAGLDRRSQRFALTPRNAALTAWLGSSDSGNAVWRLERYNDCSHLWSGGALRHRSEPSDAFSQSGEAFWKAVERS